MNRVKSWFGRNMKCLDEDTSEIIMIIPPSGKGKFIGILRDKYGIRVKEEFIGRVTAIRMHNSLALKGWEIIIITDKEPSWYFAAKIQRGEDNEEN